MKQKLFFLKHKRLRNFKKGMIDRRERYLKRKFGWTHRRKINIHRVSIEYKPWNKRKV